MHEPVVDGLEEYLAGTLAGERLDAFQRHVAGCADCQRLLRGLPWQQALLRELRPPRPMAPAPGFYARVRSRIEAQRASSIWSVFLEPAFGRRLSYAALALSLVLSLAVWDGWSQPVIDETNPVMVLAIEMPEAPGLDPGHDRAVVLSHLVSTGDGDELPSLPISSD